MVDFGGYRIHFRDRENEARVFLGEALRYVGIRIIYGPYGAGKTTFLSLINSTLKSLGGEVFIVYMNFEGRALSSILESSLPNGREVVERVRSLLGNVDALKAGMLIAEALKEGITYAISRVKAMEARRLLILIDNLDKYLKEEGGMANTWHYPAYLNSSPRPTNTQARGFGATSRINPRLLYLH